jgi:hypothetical protein
MIILRAIQMNKDSSYTTPTDYSLLYSLIVNGAEVVCFVGPSHNLFIAKYDNGIAKIGNSVSHWGTGCNENFINWCERNNLEFIEPNL